MRDKIETLDTLSAILPALAGSDRAEQLARLLTDEDIDTLRHLAREGMGENSLRALTSDFSYLEGWCLAATGSPLPWPAPAPLILKFIAHHLWDSEKKISDPGHGMPEDIATQLEAQGLLRSAKNTAGQRPPHAPATVQRRLASWSTLHRWRGLTGDFSAAEVRSAMRLAVRVADRPRARKSRKAITADCLELLLATCDGTDYAAPSLMDIRDRALLLVGFASGGRRRSELSGMRFGQITWEDFLPLDPSDPDSDLLPAASLRLGRTKTEKSSDDNSVLLIGRSVDALKAWLAAARIQEGAVFRAIDQWGNLKSRALTPQSVNAIVKKRCALAGLDPQDFSAHGLRSGFLTEAANRDIPIQDAMLQSRHRSLAQASSYYSDAGRSRRRSARLLG
ncbi:tyrosine-type recombinase/integrase [Labrenzia sp. 5N]|uniref:tyrosine-type recombinase/integrase n=1 Tax=Labrenzia sp. 5N TaxID=2723402 RepID=UPI0025711509|nr:tyrosine-type recombinase/integrase [Labrenzia sp. 5N]